MMTRAVCRSASGARGENSRSIFSIFCYLWGALRLPCTRGYAFESSTDTCHYVPTALWYCMTEGAGVGKKPAVSRHAPGRAAPSGSAPAAPRAEPGRERSDPPTPRTVPLGVSPVQVPVAAPPPCGVVWPWP